MINKKERCGQRGSIGRGLAVACETLSVHPKTLRSDRLEAGPTWVLGCTLILAAVVTLSGCTRPVEIPPMDVKVVDAYGVKLDDFSPPQQVVYVLLRSLREDVEAAQAGDRSRQKEAFKVTFCLAAYGEIENRLKQGLGVADLGDSRERKIYDVINHWAPIAGHYVRSFEMDEKAAIDKFRTTVSSDGGSAVVLTDVVHDPESPDPADRRPVVFEVNLVREKSSDGSREFWRVARVDFRGLAGRPASRPVSGPAGTQPADG
ncbi:MAG TPA: hypothetical protein VLM89_13460 [Phycisphaerae bacterium]|nr:hypothetical protein [Phycisphaerae bacterium]